MSNLQSDAKILSEQQIKDSIESDYMNDAQLAFFRNRLVELHDSTRERIRDAKQQM